MTVSHLLNLLVWLDIKSLLLFSCIFIIFFEYVRNKPPKNFPPGPRTLPFIGNLHNFRPSKIHIQLGECAEKYGRVFSVRIFGPRLVLLNGYKLVKKVYVDQGDDYADRPDVPMLQDTVGGKGLVASNGPAWKQQRRFALSTLRNFGLGKKSLEPSIHLEARYLSEAISNEQGRPFNPRLLLNSAVSNVICVLVFGDRFEYSDSELQMLLKTINEIIFLEGGILGLLYNMFPWLMQRLPGPHQKIFTLWSRMVDFARRKIEEHKVDCDPSNPRDYIDCFLMEMEKWKDYEAAGFNMENLCFCTLDLFTAGTETTATTLHWALLYMIKYPEVQAKVQSEIDRVVGSSRQPSVMDRENLPYTNAVIHEVQRVGNIIPLNVVRAATKDTHIEGYSIPKGTMVAGDLTSVLFDETEWETPHSFNPGHFLDVNENFRKRDAFMPFSAGKRVCLGEQLARMELFLFFTSLLQRFTFKPPEGVEPSLEYIFRATHSPKPYLLCAVPR
ncbi:cytochrome P450 2J2-like [Hoplias malabaricus]|uniref:cytochrome P450 2J2-like n=1 Tax=Hoplias malabaricus TaxID=27720 RepID=UPI003462D738